MGQSVCLSRVLGRGWWHIADMMAVWSTSVPNLKSEFSSAPNMYIHLTHLWTRCSSWLIGLVTAGRRNLCSKQSVKVMQAEWKHLQCAQEQTWCCRVNRAGWQFTRQRGSARKPVCACCCQVGWPIQNYREQLSTPVIPSLVWAAQPGMINKRTEHGETALLVAVSREHLGCVEVLLGRGADPDIPNYDKETPLYKGKRDRTHMEKRNPPKEKQKWWCKWMKGS